MPTALRGPNTCSGHTEKLVARASRAVTTTLVTTASSFPADILLKIKEFPLSRCAPERSGPLNAFPSRSNLPTPLCGTESFRARD